MKTIILTTLSVLTFPITLMAQDASDGKPTPVNTPSPLKRSDTASFRFNAAMAKKMREEQEATEKQTAASQSAPKPTNAPTKK